MVEQRILESLDVWLTVYELQETVTPPYNAGKIELLESRISACRTELEEAEKQLEKQYDFLERGVYTDELTARLEDLKKELKEEAGRKAAIQNLIPALKTIHNAYSQIDSPSARNALLKEVIDHVEYTKTKGGRWGRPDNFTIEIFPRVQ